MVRIRVSYEQPEELVRVLKLLGPVIKRWRKAGQQDGKFLKAYIDLKQEGSKKNANVPNQTNSEHSK